MNLYLLTTRELLTFPSNGVVVELEDILVETCGARLLSPRYSATLFGKAYRRIFHRDLSAFTMLIGVSPPPLTPELAGHPSDRVLLVVGMTSQSLGYLRLLHRWRQNFAVVAAYIFDPWWPAAEIPEGILRKLDRVFVPDARIAERYQKLYGARAEPVPLAADVLRMGSASLDRPLDLLAYGRQDPVLLQQILEAYNDPASNRFVYHDTISARHANCLVTDFHANRRLIWKLLRKSRCALAFRPGIGGLHRDSFVPIRYYEAAAAGTAIVGIRPQVPEMEEQFNWVDSTLELPDSPGETIDFLDALLEDSCRLNAIHRRNYSEALKRHYWRYRLRDIFKSLNLAVLEALQKELSELAVKREEFRM